MSIEWLLIQLIVENIATTLHPVVTAVVVQNNYMYLECHASLMCACWTAIFKFITFPKENLTVVYRLKKRQYFSMGNFCLKFKVKESLECLQHFCRLSFNTRKNIKFSGFDAALLSVPLTVNVKPNNVMTNINIIIRLLWNGSIRSLHSYM